MSWSSSKLEWWAFGPTITWHLIPDTWYLTSIFDMLLLDTWYLTPDIWQLTCYHLLDMLSHGTRTFDLILCHLTEYYYIWHLYYIVYSWLSLLQGLDMIIILLQDLWYSWTPVLLNSCIPEPLKRGDSWYYTPVDPRNRITMNIGLLWTPCGHYHWTKF